MNKIFAKKILSERKIFFDRDPPPNFFRNVLPTFRKLPSGTTVHILTVADRLKVGDVFVSRSGVTYSFGLEREGNGYVRIPTETRIVPNGEFERSLLDRSYSYAHAPEILQLRVFDARGKVIAEQPFVNVGEQDGISEFQVADAWNNLPIPKSSYLIEIAHTHSNYEFAWGEPGKNATDLRTSPLSVEDRDIHKKLAELTNKFIRMKAILPNGYSYTEVIKDGYVVSDPFPIPLTVPIK